MTAVSHQPRHVGVLVIGAGFAGLGAAITLSSDGRDVVVLERATSVGGTWRDNTYPGAQCDVPSHVYSFSFAPNAQWTRSYSCQPEIYTYLERTAERYGLTDRIVLDCEVRNARWDQLAQHWLVETSRGQWTADILVAAMGALSEPAMPAIAGISDFAGEIFHSSQWNHEVDLGGKRVAVVGTGASAVQIVPAIVDAVAHLDVYQRTAPWVLPRRDRPYRRGEKSAFAVFPGYQHAARAGLRWARELPALALTKNPQRRTKPLQLMARAHLRRQVRDPELREQLTPRYTIGCKRMLLSNTWYPALQRANVGLRTDGIAHVRHDSIVSNDGRISPIDIIVLATGFAVTNSPAFERIVGADGRSLAERWRHGGMQAYKGSVVTGFPNLFLMMGPNTGLGHTSVVLMMEAQLSYLRDALRVMDDRRLATFDVRPEAQAAYNEHLQRKLSRTVWSSGGCRSWYLDAEGRNPTLWPGTTGAFSKLTEQFDLGAYETTSRSPVSV